MCACARMTLGSVADRPHAFRNARRQPQANVQVRRKGLKTRDTRTHTQEKKEGQCTAVQAQRRTQTSLRTVERPMRVRRLTYTLCSAEKRERHRGVDGRKRWRGGEMREVRERKRKCRRKRAMCKRRTCRPPDPAATEARMRNPKHVIAAADRVPFLLSISRDERLFAHLPSCGTRNQREKHLCPSGHEPQANASAADSSVFPCVLVTAVSL